MNKIYNAKIEEIKLNNTFDKAMLLFFSTDCIGEKILDTYLILDLDMKEDRLNLYKYLMEDKKYEYASCDLSKAFRICVYEIDNENHIPVYCDIVVLTEDYDIYIYKNRKNS